LSSLKIKPVETNQLFFGKHRYSVRFDLRELGVIRGLNPNTIDQVVKERNAWRNEHKRLYNFSINMHQIDTLMAQNLKDLCNLIAPHKKNIKFVVSFDRGYVYTNDIELVKAIAATPFLDKIRIQQAMPVCPAGTIGLKNPKWSHRTYFKSKALSEDQRNSMSEYLRSRENIRLSPGLTEWVNLKTNSWWTNWTHNHFFMDHNNDGELLFLNMVVPNITGRTMAIVAK
jgi:hypothetical protein